MSKGVKITLFVLLAFFVAGAVGIAGTASYLRTSSGSAFVLAHLKQILQDKAGAHLEYAQGRIDPFSGAHFENLKLVQDQGGKHLDVSIQSVDLEYSISFFARKVVVEKFDVEQPSIVFRAVSDTVAAAEKSPVQATASPDVASARKSITSPPVQITMKEMAVNGLDLELDQRDPAQSLQARIHGMSLHTALEWVRGRLNLSGDFDLGQAGPIIMTQSAGGATTRTTTRTEVRASGTAKWGVTIQPAPGGSGWAYELSPLLAAFAVQDVSVVKTGTAGELTVRLPSLKINSSSKFAAKTAELFTAEPGALQVADTRAQIVFGALTVDQTAPGKEPVRIVYGGQELKLTSALKDGFVFDVDYEGKGLFSSAYFTRPASLSGTAQFHLTQDLKQLESKSLFSISGIRIKDADFKARVLPSSLPSGKGGFETEGKVRLTPDPRLAQLIKPAAALKNMGSVETELGFKTHADGNYATLVDALQALAQAKLDAQVDFTATQKAGGKPVVRFEPMHMIAVIARDPAANTAKIHLTAQAPSVLGPPLKKACAFELASDLQWDGAQNMLNTDVKVLVQKQEALHVKSQTVLKTDDLESTAAFDFKVGEYLEGLFTPQSLKGYGQWLMQGQFELKKTQDTLNEDGSITISQVAAPGALSVSLPEPIKITQKLAIDPRSTLGELVGDMPQLESSKFGRVLATHFSATVSTPQSALGKDLDLKMELKQGDLVLSEAFAKKAPKLAGLEMSAKGQLRGGNQLELQNFTANLGHSIVTMSADATGKLKTRDFEARGIMALHIPADFPKVDGASMNGSIEIPWTLSVVRGKEVDLDGTAFLENLSASTPQGGVSGVSGSIPLSEKLKWDGKHIHFTHLITQNPFERVDFERVRPLIEGADQVRIDRIHWEEKSYGPLVAYFSMRQNMLQAQQLDMSLGQGKIYGEMFFDAYPASLRLGLLSRITNLDLGDVLPSKYLAKTAKDDKKISARSGVVVDLNKRSVDGRVDLTEIGPRQLGAMINLMDPQFQDEKMNRIRGELSIGYPEDVQIALAQGYADIDIKMNVHGATIPESVPGFPISSMLTDKTSDLMKKTQEGPLK